MANDKEPVEELLEDDEAEYSKKAQYSKATVIQQQVQKCNELRSKEMSEGHTMRLLDKQGNLKIVDIPDGRQPYINSVIALSCNLTPEINREETIKTHIKTINDKANQLMDTYKYKEIEMFRDDEGKALLRYTGREYMPKKGAVLIEGIQKTANGPMPLKTLGFWDTKVSAYWDEMVFVYDELFSELQILIDKNDYFKEKSGW